LVDITEGANVFGGLLAPNVNGVLLDVVMVVLAVGKLKPDAEPLPNKGADDVVVAIDIDAGGKLFGNENPLVVDVVNEAVVIVVGAVIWAGTRNRLGIIAEVVDDDDGGTDRVEALVPKENCGGLSDEIVEETAASVVVVVASGVLPNDPNVIDVGILIGDDDAVVAGIVIIEGAIGVLVAAVVLVADVAEPNDGNVEDVLVLI
jgi:hypothetical protein